MEESIINYRNLKYIALVALVLSLLCLWLIPGSINWADAVEPTTEQDDAQPEVQPEVAAVAIKATRTTTKSEDRAIESPTETADEIIEAKPEATEDTEITSPPQPINEADYRNRYAGIIPSISDSDRDILVRLVYHESRGIGGEAVMETVLNRMLDNEFPDTVQGVVYQKNQFEPAKGLYSYPINEPDSFALCEEIVEKVLSADYEPILPSYYLYFNNFKAGSSDYVWLGGNVFYGYPA